MTTKKKMAETVSIEVRCINKSCLQGNAAEKESGSLLFRSASLDTFKTSMALKITYFISIACSCTIFEVLCRNEM